MTGAKNLISRNVLSMTAMIMTVFLVMMFMSVVRLDGLEFTVVIPLFFFFFDLFQKLVDSVHDDAAYRRQPWGYRPFGTDRWVGNSVLWHRCSRCGRCFGRAFGLAHEGHAIFLRLVTSFAIGAGLRHHMPVIIVKSDTDKAFFSGNIASLGVSINEPGVGLFPLSEATVFTFFVDFAGVAAVENGVEHDLWIVTVRIRSCTQTLGIGNDPGVFAHQGAVGRVVDIRSAQCEPLGGCEVLSRAEGL